MFANISKSNLFVLRLYSQLEIQLNFTESKVLAVAKSTKMWRVTSVIIFQGERSLVTAKEEIEFLRCPKNRILRCEMILWTLWWYFWFFFFFRGLAMSWWCVHFDHYGATHQRESWICPRYVAADFAMEASVFFVRVLGCQLQRRMCFWLQITARVLWYSTSPLLWMEVFWFLATTCRIDGIRFLCWRMGGARCQPE